jgi:OPT family oligopeptide transporter
VTDNLCVLKSLLVWFRKDIARRFRFKLSDERDVHSRLMQAYPEVPVWWYIAVGVVSFALFCVSIEIFPTQLPIWAAVFGVVVSAGASLPLAILQAITNQSIATQLLDELLAGYLLPGKPIANTIFKTVTLMTSNQAVSFAGDLKLGHYMKIPPRMMFSIQMISTVVAAIWVSLLQDWMISNIQDICSPHQRQGFVCPGTTTFATSSVVWGAVGPTRMFSIGAP